MCSVNILIIILQIAEAINDLSFARFRVKDAEFDRNLATLPWGGKIKVKQPDENAPLPTMQEVSAWAHKAFLLLCDLYRIDASKDKDLDAIQKTEVYVVKLTEIANTTPDFHKVYMDDVAIKSYHMACLKLEERQWFSIKNSLVVCRGAVFAAQGESPNESSNQTATKNDGYTVNRDQLW